MRAALIAGLLALALTAVAGAMTWSVQLARAQNQFDFRVEEITEKIRARMLSYEQVLRGGVALFAASDDVSREDWATYVETLSLAKSFPGFQGVGFSERIVPEALETHVARVRAEGFPDYEVHPAGARDEYHSIVYLEPFDWRNQRAFGYDMATEPTRRAAMVRARDTGQAVLSGAVTLVQETGEEVQAGFNLYLPVYQDGLPTATVEQRRDALVGFVYSPFRINDLLRGILGAEPELIHLEIFDGRNAGDDTRMYSSGAVSDIESGFHTTTTLEIADHAWTLAFSSDATFGDRLERWRARVVMLAGLVISALLFLFMWAIAGRRRRAEEFSGVVASALDAVIIIDSDDRIIEFNPSAEAMFGYSRTEAVGRRMAELIVPPHLRERHLAGVRAFVQTGKGKLGNRAVELEAMRRDGSTFPVEVSITRIGTKNPPHFSGFVRDISERKDRQQELLRMNTELEQRVAERTHELEAFAYSVSHDLRGPLRAMDGFSAELQRLYGDRLDESGQHFVERIRAGAMRMGQLIDDLLQLSRVSQRPIHRSDVDLSEVAMGVLAQLRSEDPARDVSTEVESTEPVFGDPRLLQIVLDNLLRNAWKFSSKTRDARIVFGCRTQEPETVYFVQDNGAGFDATYADSLFVPFQRLHSEQEFPGTGIGLATVQRVVQRHGGRVWAESAEGHGATFWFTIGEGHG
ncbi:MAG: CHASE domain-containing protein [Gammaproteobacteria bacterium]